MFFSIPKAAAIALLSQCLLTAAAVPRPRALDGRAALECSKPDIVKVVNVLKKFPALGSGICSNLLKYPPPTTVTQSTTITNTVLTTVTGSTTTTLLAGTSTASADATVTSTVNVASLTTSTETTTLAQTVTNTITNTNTVTAFAPTTTVTTTVFNSPNLKKRQSGRKLGDVYPNCPNDLKSTLLTIAETACKCFLGPAELPKTKTVTVTETATSTVNAVGTSTTTVPAATITVTSTTTAIVTATTPSTVKTTLSASTTVTTSVITTATTTTFSTPTATQTVTVTVAYTKVRDGDSCTYNRYTDGFSVDNSPNNNYSVGINQCKTQCDTRPGCKFFFYLRFDPARARGADYGYCFIDNQPYDASFLQCGYPTQKYAAYQKN